MADNETAQDNADNTQENGEPAATETATSGYSVDRIDFNDSTVHHIGVYSVFEEALDAAENAELPSGSMVRVSSLSFFRANLDD